MEPNEHLRRIRERIDSGFTISEEERNFLVVALDSENNEVVYSAMENLGRLYATEAEDKIANKLDATDKSIAAEAIHVLCNRFGLFDKYKEHIIGNLIIESEGDFDDHVIWACSVASRNFTNHQDSRILKSILKIFGIGRSSNNQAMIETAKNAANTIIKNSSNAKIVNSCKDDFNALIKIFNSQ
jgi:hypothetical protein